MVSFTASLVRYRIRGSVANESSGILPPTTMEKKRPEEKSASFLIQLHNTAYMLMLPFNIENLQIDHSFLRTNASERGRTDPYHTPTYKSTYTCIIN